MKDAVSEVVRQAEHHFCFKIPHTKDCLCPPCCVSFGILRVKLAESGD